ncbi:extended synaptotagmin-1-like isoform X2 [Xenopus tropicalis]|uniref:Extended synaptotagmin-1-like isoform X2 n=1 Tax=Xenopus tropicalis TaxID=8364 RepID=A0A8J1JBF2_XENTR|nr:extended synaptotagmin-1-like isoform X2 [Xenopus tropicalis]
MAKSLFILFKLILFLFLGFSHSKINVPVPYVATWVLLRYFFSQNTEDGNRSEWRPSWLRLALTFYIGYVAGKMAVPISIFVVGLLAYWWRHREEETVPRLKKKETGEIIVIPQISMEDYYRNINMLVDRKEEEDKPEEILPVVWPGIARILYTETDEDTRIDDLNKVLVELWPYFGQYIKNLLVDWYEPMIREKCASFRFSHVDLGEKVTNPTLIIIPRSCDRFTMIHRAPLIQQPNAPCSPQVPLITGTRLHIRSERKQVVLDLDLSYDGNAAVKIALGRRCFRIGAKQLAAVGTLRVVLAPLMDEMPLFGSLTWYLPRRPEVLEVNWSGLRHLLKIPGVSEFLGKAVMHWGVENMFVAPHCMPTKLLKSFRLDRLFFRVTRNIIRVHILEAEDLVSEDSGIFCPYAVISGSQQKGKTKVAKRSRNPSWNQAFEMRFNDLPMQEIDISLFHRGVKRDLCLGSWTLGVEEVISQKAIDKVGVKGDINPAALLNQTVFIMKFLSHWGIFLHLQWLPIQNAASGRLHVLLQCLELARDTTELPQVMITNRISRPTQINRFSAAVIFILVEEGKDLRVKNNVGLPTSHAVVKIGKKSFSGKVCRNTATPQWRAKSSFLLEKPHNESVKITVKDKNHGSLGTFTLQLSELLLAENLTMEGWHQLDAAFPQGSVWIRFELRVLVPPKEVESLNDS